MLSWICVAIVMVELCAELQGVGTYLAGEWVTCAVTFTNRGEGEETVAWAGAQVHCQCCYRENVVRVDTSEMSHRSPITDTAFVPNRGLCVRVGGGGVGWGMEWDREGNQK